MKEILLVEDNIADAEIIIEKLSDSTINKYNIQHASLFAEGLGYMETNKYDLVIMDIGLPDVIGLSGIENILLKHPSTPIIAISGDSDEAKAFEIIKMGAQDYLVKESFNDKILLKSIEYSIERQKNRKENHLLTKTVESNLKLIKSLKEELILCRKFESSKFGT